MLFGYDYQGGGPLVETEPWHMCQKGEDMSSYKEGQIHMLANSLEREGFSAEHLSMLGQDNQGILALLMGVLVGTHEIRVVEHIVDLSSIPNPPFDGAKVVAHVGEGFAKLEKHGGNLYINGQRTSLYRSRRQRGRRYIKGNELGQEITRHEHQCLSACILDYLELHPELWPDIWKQQVAGKAVLVCFWGDIFCRPAEGGDLYVRSACWEDGRVVSYRHWLAGDWHYDRPAACLEA